MPYKWRKTSKDNESHTGIEKRVCQGILHNSVQIYADINHKRIGENPIHAANAHRT
jgi:hypothetical protein